MDPSAIGMNVLPVLESAPVCHRLARVWDGWRGRGPIPAHADMRPEQLGGALNGITLLEMVSEDAFVYRICASRLDRIRRESVLGRNYLAMSAPAERAIRQARMLNVIRQPCAALSGLKLALTDGFEVDLKVLMLPLAASSGGHGFIVSGVDILGDRRWSADATFERVPLPDSFAYLDLGFGLPAAGPQTAG